MADVVQIKEGMPVLDAAGDWVGALESIDQQAIHVGGRAVPLSLVERIAADGIHLAAGAASVLSSAGRRGDSGATAAPAAMAAPQAAQMQIVEAEGEVHVPLAGERIVVETHPTRLGSVDIQKRVEQVEDVVRHPVSHEEVEVERVPVNRQVDSAPPVREEGEWLIVPVMEEQLIVQRRLVLKEEVRVRRRTVTEQREFRGLVTRERVDIADPGGWVAERKTETEPAPAPASESG
jgi:uncharacterized protein (TIGR02271 family)